VNGRVITRTAPILLLASACRAPAIPLSQCYPAGTALAERYVDVAGTRIRYIEAGRGPAVVLIHGLAASLYAWRHTIEPVAAAGYRVIAYDNRGFGFSGKPLQGYTNQAYIELLVDLLDSLKIHDAILVGHSMGGAIAAETALAHPDRVRGLVLVDAAGVTVRWPFLLRIARWPLVGTVFEHFRSRWVTARILKTLYADPSRVTTQDIEQYYAPQVEPGFAHSLRSVLGAYRFDALQGRLERIEKPTLVMWGERDRVIPASIGRDMVSHLQLGAFVLFNDAGHALPEELPAEFNRTLLAFLANGLPTPPSDVATLPRQDWKPRGSRRIVSSTKRLTKIQMKPKLSNPSAIGIVSAAREEFAARGFHGSRVARIAQRAGVNKQLLFYYFNSKQGLFQAVVGSANAELEAALIPAQPRRGTPLDRLRTALEQQFEYLATHPELVTVLSQADRTDMAPFAPVIRHLVVLLAEGQGMGQVRDDIDPHLVAAQALVLMLSYLNLETVIAASAPPLRADEPALRERWWRSAVELVLNSVRV
jgi:pimeloyl-ACP methyl ester carboxylesterase/AcrR family transcriptional regulator